MKLKDKVVLLTGGTSPLGSQIARRLATEGARLALLFHKTRNRAEALKRELTQKDADAEIFSVDLSDTNSIHTVVKAATDCFGRLDVLINNASVFFPTPFERIRVEDWEKIFSVNARAPFLLIRECASWLKKSKGVVVNISDVYAENPVLRDFIPYCASKAALNAGTKAFAHALAPDVRVVGVAPGAITFPEDYSASGKKKIIDRIPVNRPGTPEDIAEAVYFLIAEAPYTTGQIISVDGGRFM